MPYFGPDGLPLGFDKAGKQQAARDEQAEHEALIRELHAEDIAVLEERMRREALVDEAEHGRPAR